MNRATEFLYILKKLAMSVALVMMFTSLHAEWDPEDCLLDFELESFVVLEEPDFKALKKDVSNILEGSWCTDEKSNLLMDLIYLIKPDVCVDIGAFTGSTVLPVAMTLKTLKHGKIYAVDAWSNEEAIKGLSDNDPNRAWWSSLSMRDVRASYDQMIRKCGLNSVCTTLHLTSEEAIHQIDEIDFLHLDGNFSEAGALRDVELYLPKVKEGGYILLSNLFLMSNSKQPKLKSFCALFDTCEMICDIDRDNAVLFKKE